MSNADLAIKRNLEFQVLVLSLHKWGGFVAERAFSRK